MRALVTGAAGFVGSHLVSGLRGQGHDVIGLDSFTDYYDVTLKRANAEQAIRAGAHFIDGDLNVVDLHSLLDGVDVVFHLAGQPGVRSCWGKDFSTYTYCNIEATQRLLEACKEHRTLRRLVYASSSSVYGNADRYPTSEQDRPKPFSPYGVTKLAAEHLCNLYAEGFGVPAVSLRYFTVYGPGQRPDMAFSRFSLAAARGDDIVVYGSGEQIRDFTFVQDVVAANILAATCAIRPGTVLNVAGGSHTSVNEVLRIIQDVAGTELSVIHAGAVAGDVHQTGGDTTAIRSVLQWRPVVGLREGIEHQFHWAAALVAS
ncbi:MAG: NAD-dependent epimerase/dehydratase family protein [Mycobacterium sp.]